MSGVVYEIGDDGEPKVVGPATAEQTIQAAAETQPITTDDPLAGLEDLRRQVETKDRERLDAENRAREANARAETDRRNAVAAQEETRRAQALADSNGYDSVVNALALTERELSSLQSLKATALEKGDYEKVAVYDGQMSKVGARSVQLETAKSQIERTRQNAPPAQQQQAQQPAPSQQDQNDTFMRNLPAQSADWIRAHPQFFNDQNFQQKVMAAANSAETIHGINHNNHRYFEMIEEAVGLRLPQQPATSAAANAQPRQNTATVPPPPPPPPPPAAAVPRQAAPSAAPSRSDPTPGPTSDGRVVVLSAQEREFAHQLFPRRKSSDPDPELLYAKNKSKLIQEGKLQA